MLSLGLSRELNLDLMMDHLEHSTKSKIRYLFLFLIMSCLGTSESFGCLNKNKEIYIFSLVVGLHKTSNCVRLATLPFAFMFPVNICKVGDWGS